MKRYIVAFLAIVAFITIYYFTRSWMISLIVFGILLAYLAWLIRFELGIGVNKDRAEGKFNSMKEKHIKDTEDNPTLR